MASGLAARIKEIFGITPKLVEGHDGIYEVSLNGKVIVTNRGKCTGVPSEDQILTAVRSSVSPLPGMEKMVKTVLPMA